MTVSNPFDILIALADCGSLSAAAVRLRITQPGVTKALQRLEAEMGAPLVERSARGMRFTVYGQAVLGHARQIDATMRHVHEEVRQLRGEHDGEISLAIAHSAANLLLPRVIERFRMNWGQIMIRVVAGVFPGLLVPLREGSIDLAVVPLPQQPLTADFDSQPLFQTHVVVVARKGHPLGAARELSALAQASWVLPGVGTSSGRALGEAFAMQGLGSPRCVTVSESLSVMQALIGSSDLLGVIPDEHHRPRRFVPPGLVVLPLREKLSGAYLHLVSRSGTQQTPALRRLSALFADEAANFQQQPDPP